MRGFRTLLKDAWRLASPFFRSEEKGAAWALLVTVLALNLSLVGMSVVLSFWNREFFNTLQTKDAQAFLDLLIFYRRTDSGLMPGFVYVAALYIVVAVSARYVEDWLSMRWRRWGIRPTRQLCAPPLWRVCVRCGRERFRVWIG